MHWLVGAFHHHHHLLTTPLRTPKNTTIITHRGKKKGATTKKSKKRPTYNAERAEHWQTVPAVEVRNPKPTTPSPTKTPRNH